jgi:glycosyltransferase involved in cell wall biosynthesis
MIPCAVTPYRLAWKLFLVLKVIQLALFRTDFMICGHVNLSPICFALKKLSGLNYVVIIHGIEVWNLQSKLLKKSLAEATTLFAVSRYTRDKVQEQIPALKGKIEIVANTVDASRFMPQPKSADLMSRYSLSGYQTLLTVGRLSASDSYKGYDTIMRALPEVLRVKPKVKYLIVGKGDALASLKKLARELGIEANVIFTGFVPDEELVDYYNLSDAFVMPSKGEGFGIVFLEAMACGKPVLASNADGACDPLMDGKLGILVDPDDEKEVAQAILRLLNEQNQELLRNPEYLRQTVIQNFGIERFRQRVVELFRELKLVELS